MNITWLPFHCGVFPSALSIKVPALEIPFDECGSYTRNSAGIYIVKLMNSSHGTDS